MRSWLVIFLWLVLAGGVVFAQEQPSPLGAVGTLEAGDFRALAVTAAGDRLLVADAENQQVRIYDFSDPTTPALLWTLDVSGTPVLLAGGEGYGLVVVTTDADADTIEIVAPQFPDRPYSSGFNYIDIPKNPHALALSPDKSWGIVISKSSYTLMQIAGANEINNSLPIDLTVLDAALSDTTAYVVHDQVLATAPLGELEALQPALALGLDGAPSLVRLNPDASQGVVVLDGSRLLFFDPATLEQTGEFTVEGSPITDVQFLSSGDAEYVLVTQADTSTIAVLDARDPASVQALASTQPLDHPVQALTVYDHYLIVTDGATIRIFST